MKLILSFFVFLCFSANVFSQDVNQLLKEADRLESIPNEIAAFNKLKEVLVVQPANIHALSKCSELCSRIGTRQTDTKNRDNYFSAALTYAQRALTISPQSDKANVSMAMIVGKSSMYKSGKEKIKSAKEVKRLLDVAIKTNPNNWLAWHILGRWNYEISNVSSIERAAARVFYSGLPEGSLQNSIMYLEKAKSLSPRFALNTFELAKAYHRNDEDVKAISLLKSLQSLPIGTEDDPMIKAQALKLIQSWE
jgi:tetratricopeptide (TPR) repeat protein